MGHAARTGVSPCTGIPDDLGTAVNVVQMVFGNKGETSGTGVCFTRDPSTGEPGLYGEFLAGRAGRGRRVRDQDSGAARGDALANAGAFDELLETMRRLGAHYRDMQDIEFTVEDGKLYLLQTRAAKRTAAAALKAAVDMVDERLIEREDAVARIDPAQLDRLLHPDARPRRHLRGSRPPASTPHPVRPRQYRLRRGYGGGTGRAGR